MGLPMQVPLKIAFKGCEPSDAARFEIERHAARLEQFHDRITTCQVVVEVPGTRHRKGDPFGVRVRVAMPGRKDIVVNRPHGDKREHEHINVAIKDAFAAVERQIEDVAREKRGQVKTHEAPATGKVTKFVADDGYGFIETLDGREIYFHRNSVLNGAFDYLSVGVEVRFAEELGEKGPQASSVHLVGRRHTP